MCSARPSSARSRCATASSRRRPSRRRTPNALVTDDLIAFHRLPGRGRGRHDDRRLLRGDARAAAPTADRSGCAPRRCPGCGGSPRPCTPRAPRSARRSATPARSANARSNKATALAPVPVLQPAVDEVRQAGHPRRHQRRHRRARRRRPGSRSTPASTPSRSTSATTTSASSFLTPLINRRTDEFGGSLENRAKVARGMVMAVRREVERSGSTDRGDRQAQHGRRGARRHHRRGVAADREVAAGRRRPRRPRTDRGQLAGQPDVPVPRRRPGQGVRRGASSRRCAGACG